jgi:hypothetical protein
MAKFIDKKEQVYDLKLTSYGHYLFSIGTFKPKYYTFLDDNVIYDKQYAMARRPHATYTQVAATASTFVGGKTLILTDASSTQHTITLKIPGQPAQGTAHFTTSTSAIVTDLTRSYDIAVQVARAINSASAEGLIGMRAGEVFGGLETEDESDSDNPPPYALLGTTASFGLTMDLTGTQGNAKGISGTIITATPNLADATAFGGGYNPRLEPQNEVHKRIKDETQYLESFVLFRDIESGSVEQEIIEEDDQIYFKGDVTPTMMIPKSDVFKFNGIIGDAYLEGETQAVPAWKVALLQGLISSSTAEDSKNVEKIPQINVELNYTLEPRIFGFEFDPTTLRDTIDETLPFIDNYTIALKPDDIMVYMEEVNTELLTENFDIEVFKVMTGSNPDQYDTLERKFFRKVSNQIVNGVMRTERPAPEALWFGGWRNMSLDGDLSPDSVEYYFDILTDTQVNKTVACNGAGYFNRSSYYIDIDFDCDQLLDEESIYYDIYGSAMEPEICLD